MLYYLHHLHDLHPKKEKHCGYIRSGFVYILRLQTSQFAGYMITDVQVSDYNNRQRGRF